jgi:hypothetical protein
MPTQESPELGPSVPDILARRQQVLARIKAAAQDVEEAIRQETQGYIPEKNLTHEGCVALARVSVFDPTLFLDVKAQVMQQITAPDKPEPLVPRLVNRIWIDRRMKQEKKTGRIGAKTYVLNYLFTHCEIEQANPSMTHEEMYDALNKKRRPHAPILVPQLSFSPATQYNEPPYLYLFAQIRLDERPSLVADISKRVDPKYPRGHIHYRKLSLDFQGILAQKYAEMLAQEGIK